MSNDEAKRNQVIAQCKAIKHMAAVLSKVYGDFSMMFQSGHMDTLLEMKGRDSAVVMEWLGDLLNDMDCVQEEDEWMEPIFRAAHEMFPKEPTQPVRIIAAPDVPFPELP